MKRQYFSLFPIFYSPLSPLSIHPTFSCSPHACPFKIGAAAIIIKKIWRVLVNSEIAVPYLLTGIEEIT